ncbi:porin family protein [Photobacterium indicum]|uniref:Porin family protein n=1 Tax=Photobacterium indicum TaxID=81447 RepID=A0A2T3LD34_9GAMM|nr:porin family protein [Photobacterium indicum]PSV49268.1 porin family protein [Photobacterium indicum]
MKKLLLAATLVLTCLPASADILGISVGASAGASRVDYKGNTDTGYEYGIDGTYHINDIFSVNVGIVQGSADVDDDISSFKNDIDYTAVPITLRGDLPLLIGSLYAKAGTSYYDVDISNASFKDDGWGFTGGAGFVLTLIPLIDLTLGYEYRDMGEVENNAVVLGVGFRL